MISRGTASEAGMATRACFVQCWHSEDNDDDFEDDDDDDDDDEKGKEDDEEEDIDGHMTEKEEDGDD